MSTPIANPGALSIDVPVRLNTYLSDDGAVQTFQWILDDVSNNKQPSRWNEFLFGDVEPVDYKWTKAGSAGGSASIDYVNKAYTITTNPPTAGSWVYSKDLSGIQANTSGNTFEVVLKVEQLGSGSYAEVKIEDGTYQETIQFTNTKVYFVNADVFLAFDATQSYQTYTFALKGTKLRFFLNHIWQGDITLSSTSSNKRMTFGNVGPASGTSTISKWLFVKQIADFIEQIDVTKVLFEIQTDSVDTFDSINLRDYTTNSGVLDSKSGGLSYAFDVQIPPRQLDVVPPLFWRVRANSSYYESNWVTSTYSLDKNNKQDIFNVLFNVLPDENSYSKEVASSNVATLFKAYSSEIDKATYELTRTEKDFDYSQTRDSVISGTLGVLLGIRKDSFSTSPQYKDFLRQMLVRFLKTTTTASEEDLAYFMTGMKPEIVETFKLIRWKLLSQSDLTYNPPDADYNLDTSSFSNVSLASVEEVYYAAWSTSFGAGVTLHGAKVSFPGPTVTTFTFTNTGTNSGLRKLLTDGVNLYIITEGFPFQVIKYDLNGTFVASYTGNWGGASGGNYQDATIGGGSIYILDTQNHVFKLNTGDMSTIAHSALSGFFPGSNTAVAISFSSNSLWVVGDSGGGVYKAANYNTSLSSVSSFTVNLTSSNAIVSDGSYVYVSGLDNSGNGTVQSYTVAGVTTASVNYGVSLPFGLLIDTSRSVLYVVNISGGSDGVATFTTPALTNKTSYSTTIYNSGGFNRGLEITHGTKRFGVVTATPDALFRNDILAPIYPGPYIKDPSHTTLTPYIRLMSQKGKAFTWELHVFNPFNTVFDKGLLYELAKSLSPAHTKLIIFFYSSEGVRLINPTFYGLGNYGDPNSWYVDKRFPLEGV